MLKLKISISDSDLNFTATALEAILEYNVREWVDEFQPWSKQIKLILLQA